MRVSDYGCECLLMQNLVEKIVRLKIYSMPYWKEHCFGLNAETLVDKAMDLDHVGGTYGGNQKATDFLCLVLKMCQIQPEKEIVVRGRMRGRLGVCSPLTCNSYSPSRPLDPAQPCLTSVVRKRWERAGGVYQE